MKRNVVVVCSSAAASSVLSIFLSVLASGVCPQRSVLNRSPVL